MHDLPRPFFVLAPMDDVTDVVFRQIVAETAAPDVFFTEFVNVDGLQSPGRAKLLSRLRYGAADTPLVAQIWGKNPENFYKTAKEIADGTFARELAEMYGPVVGSEEGNWPCGFAGVDINFGCPDKNVVRNGTCSAMILPENRARALEIIQASREGLNAGGGASLPLSVKTRLGFSAVDLTWHETLLQQKLNMLTIHGRTRKQMSKVPADWGLIGEVRALRDAVSPATLIVGNGDVLSRHQGEALAQQHGLDGVMIGRGIFQDPYVFAPHSAWADADRQTRIDLYRRHITLFAAAWQHGERRLVTLNKFCKIYIQGFDGAKELREQLMACQSVEELITLLK